MNHINLLHELHHYRSHYLKAYRSNGCESVTSADGVHSPIPVDAEASASS